MGNPSDSADTISVIKTKFLIPVRDNEGRAFEAEAWAELERRLLRFGGASAADRVSGTWENDGGARRETSRQYEVAIESWTDLPDWLDLIRWTRRRFQQQALYVEVAGIPEIIGGE